MCCLNERTTMYLCVICFNPKLVNFEIGLLGSVAIFPEYCYTLHCVCVPSMYCANLVSIGVLLETGNELDQRCDLLKFKIA